MTKNQPAGDAMPDVIYAYRSDDGDYWFEETETEKPDEGETRYVRAPSPAPDVGAIAEATKFLEEGIAEYKTGKTYVIDVIGQCMVDALKALSAMKDRRND